MVKHTESIFFNNRKSHKNVTETQQIRKSNLVKTLLEYNVLVANNKRNMWETLP